MPLWKAWMQDNGWKKNEWGMRNELLAWLVLWHLSLQAQIRWTNAGQYILYVYTSCCRKKVITGYVRSDSGVESSTVGSDPEALIPVVEQRPFRGSDKNNPQLNQSMCFVHRPQRPWLFIHDFAVMHISQGLYLWPVLCVLFQSTKPSLYVAIVPAFCKICHPNRYKTGIYRVFWDDILQT